MREGAREQGERERWSGGACGGGCYSGVVEGVGDGSAMMRDLNMCQGRVD